jgi:hypothetical protein
VTPDGGALVQILLDRGSRAHTDYHEFPGRTHFTVGQPGWEEVAEHALSWAAEHASLAHAHRGREAT